MSLERLRVAGQLPLLFKSFTHLQTWGETGITSLSMRYSEFKPSKDTLWSLKIDMEPADELLWHLSQHHPLQRCANHILAKIWGFVFWGVLFSSLRDNYRNALTSNFIQTSQSTMEIQFGIPGPSVTTTVACTPRVKIQRADARSRQQVPILMAELMPSNLDLP